MFALFGLLSLFICKSLGTTLVFVNNSDLIGPKITDYVVTFDTVTKQGKAYYTTIPSNDEIYSGAVVCGDMYYGVWVQLLAATGLFAFDLSNGNLTSYVTASNNYHILQCTETKGTILAVSNDFSTPPLFELDRITFEGRNKFTKTVIGKFPAADDPGGDAYDTTFSWYPSQNELWASFPNTKYNSGDLFIMDTTSGKIKNQYAYPRSYGDPYFTLPTTMKGNSFKGAVSSSQDNIDISFVTLTIDKDALDVSNKESAPYLWSDSQPQPICNGTGYAVQVDGTTIISYDIQTGKTIETFEMGKLLHNPRLDIGDLACI
eukprot:108933_1